MTLSVSLPPLPSLSLPRLDVFGTGGGKCQEAFVEVQSEHDEKQRPAFELVRTVQEGNL